MTEDEHFVPGNPRSRSPLDLRLRHC